MPIYDYACANCGHRFEAVHGVHDTGPATCPACGEGPVRKAFAAPAVLFKGSGWAKVDRRSSSGVSKSKPTEDAAAATTGAGEAKASSGSSTAAGSESGSAASSTSTD